MRFISCLFLSLIVAAPVFADITGKPRIIDGDTIEVAGERIRLHGIDAPESKQTCEWPDKTIPCGRLATLALMDLTAGAEVIPRGAHRQSGRGPHRCPWACRGCFGWH